MRKRSKIFMLLNIRSTTGLVFWIVASIVATYYAIRKLINPLLEDIYEYCSGVCDATLFTVWRPLLLLVALAGCLLAWLLQKRRGKTDFKSVWKRVVFGGSIGGVVVFGWGIYLVCEVNSWVPLRTDKQRLAVVESQDIQYSHSRRYNRYNLTSASCRSILRMLDDNSRLKMTTRKMYVNFEIGDTVAFTCNRGLLGLDYVSDVELWHKPRPAKRRSISL